MLNDPVEFTPEYLAIRDELEAEIEKRLEGIPRGLGFCHLYWGVKKSILKEKYGIDWQSPSERNPMILFD